MADGTATPAPTTGPWQHFGTRLRHWRRAAGLTQLRLATAVGYDNTAISKLEHGTRRAAAPLAELLDARLGAGGDLLAAWHTAEDQAERRPTGPLRPPVPGPADAEPGPGPGPADRAGSDVAGADPGQGPAAGLPAHLLPERLPDYGLLCPLHGADGCAVPPLAELAALHRAFCAPADPGHGAPAPLDADTAHALAALLAVHLRAGEEHPQAGLPSVEHTLRAILRRLPHTPGGPGLPLLRLAAEHAHAAGGLRMRHGRNATAMACYDRALDWAQLADDPATRVAALSDMSTLARLDGDPAAALGYAREIARAAPGRHWAGAMAQSYQARAHGLAGDVHETVRHIGRARLHLDHIGARDESDAPWLSIASMHLRVESAAAAALRDAAAAVGDARLAHRALDAAHTALRLLGPQQLPSARLLFTVRVADCHLCADDPQAALDVLTPALADAPATVPALVGHELRLLRTRLATPRWRHPDLAAAGRRLAELAP
ncbi:helix-turn-helix domain-containing protein [Kitasatospora sp. NPDC054939]